MTTKPDLTRVWASGAAAANVVDPDVTTPGKWPAGWVKTEVPPFEWWNSLMQTWSSGLAHANEYGIMEWDTDTEYPLYGLCRKNGLIFIAKSANSGNDPESSPTYWAMTMGHGVVRQTGGGALIPMVINYLEDTDTYDLPLANSLPDGAMVTTVTADKYSSFTPTVQVTGSDDLEDKTGIDADGEFLFDSGSSFEVDFITDGVDTWEI